MSAPATTLIPYVKCTSKILKSLMQEHGLDTTGNKADLVKRLSDETKHMQSKLDLLADNTKDVMQRVAELSTRDTPTVRTPGPSSTDHDDQTSNQDEALREEPRTSSVNTPRDDVAENTVRNASINTEPNDVGRMVGRTEWHSERDVIAILPEFDPIKGNLTATQFIAKINRLSEIYGWQENVVLYAVQTKLKGHAKEWLDAQEALQKWSDFVDVLVTDFPEMIDRRQNRQEATLEFYYSMQREVDNSAYYQWPT